jgi:hypothetical protein
LHQKLYPLFPPADQTQSVALRAALLRLLEQAKKNCVLGRDVLLRKTMLDECKGDRLEEVLAVFSSAVLKKVVAEHTASEKRHPALAEAFALEQQRGYAADDRAELAVLALAHKVSLRKALQEKEAARGRYAELSDLLDAKEAALQRRADRVKVDEALAGGVDAERLWEAVRASWTGDERWVDALQYGDARGGRGGGTDDWLLARPWGSIWRRVESGRMEDLEGDSSPGLIGQLEDRVKAQQSRLERWKVYQQDLQRSGDAPAPTDHKAAPRGGGLGFGAHESLRAVRLSPRKASETILPHGALDGEYASILDSLKADLVGVQGDTAGAVERMVTRAAAAPRPAANRLQTGRPQTDRLQTERPQTTARPAMNVADDETPRRGTTIRDRISQLRSARDEAMACRGTTPSPEPDREAVRQQFMPTREEHYDAEPSTSPPHSPTWAKTPHTPPLPVNDSLAPRPARRNTVLSRPDAVSTFAAAAASSPTSPTQARADQILAVVADASPTPAKPPGLTRHLSLADRARLSMVRSATSKGSKFTPMSPQDTSFADMSTMSGDLSMMPPTPCPPTTGRRGRAAADDGGDPDGIVARTRLSMIGFEAAQQRVRAEKELAARKELKAKRALGSAGRATKETWMDEAEAEALEAEAREAAALESLKKLCGEEGVADAQRGGSEDCAVEGAGGAVGDDADVGGHDETTVVVTSASRTPAAAEGDVSALAEELLGTAQDDYDAVFRSRPRLKASPVMSRVPSGEW